MHPPPMEQVLLQTVQMLQGMSEKMNQQGSSSLKLPPIQLKIYDGNPHGFLDWWIRYEALVHLNARLSDSERLIYLQQHIAPDAASKCWGQGLDALTYDKALEDVLTTFADKELLTSLYLDKIQEQKMPQDENDISGIRDLVNNTRKMIHCLQRLNVQPLEFSRMIMKCFKEKVPFSLQMKMVEKLGRKMSEISLTEFIPALDSYCSQREDVTVYLQYRTGGGQGSSGGHQGNSSHSGGSPGSGFGPQRQTTMYSRQSYDRVKGWPKCLFCQEEGKKGHAWRNCHIQDPTKRKRAFTEQKLCLNCGSARHFFNNCKSTKQCGIGGCEKSHHSSLHEWYTNRPRDRGNGTTVEDESTNDDNEDIDSNGSPA